MAIVDDVLLTAGFGDAGPDVALAAVADVIGRTWKPGAKVDRVAREVLVALGPILRDVQESRVPPPAVPDLPAERLPGGDLLASWAVVRAPDGGVVAYVHPRASSADLTGFPAGDRCPQCQVLGADRCDHPASHGPAGIALGTEPCA